MKKEHVPTTSEKIKRTLLVVLALAGITTYVIDVAPDGETHVASQVCLRLGFVLGAAWLAYPQVAYLTRNVSPAILILALVMIVFFMKYPYVLLPGISVCILLAIMQYAVRVFNSR